MVVDDVTVRQRFVSLGEMPEFDDAIPHLLIHGVFVHIVDRNRDIAVADGEHAYLVPGFHQPACQGVDDHLRAAIGRRWHRPPWRCQYADFHRKTFAAVGAMVGALSPERPLIPTEPTIRPLRSRGSAATTTVRLRRSR